MSQETVYVIWKSGGLFSSRECYGCTNSKQDAEATVTRYNSDLKGRFYWEAMTREAYDKI